MTYPIKTLVQLPLVLKAFRKEQGMTQADMAEKLGITQQSYAYFEAKPATATLERLFTVLRLLNVAISLDRESPTPVQELDVSMPQDANSRSTSPHRRSTKNAPVAISPKKKESW